jgi:predicted amidohydrolase YtcJ
MPGINDAHLHPILGASKDLFECRFDFTATPDRIAAAVSACAKTAGDSQWIRGGQWSSDFFVHNAMPSPRKWLDQFSADKAVVLVDDAYHNVWLNSRAFDLLELKEEGELPEGVAFLRDKDGKFSGVVIEAFGFLKDRLPLSTEQNKKAARHAMAAANAAGITGMKGTAVAADGIRGFAELADAGELTTHMAIAIYTGYGHRESALDIEALLAIREQYTRPGLDLAFAKVFMDGVPTAARTAAMLSPYVALPQEKEPNFGMQHLAAEQLRDDVVALDKAGFTVKIHAAGDRSVRMALDAVEAARKANGDSGLRHELAHAGFIDDSDMERFKSLQAVADLSPYIWYPSPIIDSVVSALGERGEHYWPVKDLLAIDAPVAIGSDWPAAVPTLNPWPGLESLVTRADPYADTVKTLWPEQAVTIDQAVKIFTLEGAKALRLQDKTGSIEPGKSADFIELNQDIFRQNATSISDTQVLRTWLRGKLVYKK